MFRRNLFKRFLPMALVVAMTVQSVPVTSYAAEPESGATEIAIADESASDESENDGEVTQTDEQQVAEETQAEDVKSEDTVEQTSTDEAKDEAEADEESVEIEVKADAEELPKSEIVFNFNGLGSLSQGLEFSKTEKNFKAVYAANNAAAREVLSKVKSITKVEIDTVTDADESRYNLDVTYQWQSKNDKGEWAECDVPEAVGEYRIKVSLAETAGLCKAAEDAFVDFTIEKKEITIDPEVTTFDADIEASEVIAKITEEYTVDVPDKDIGVVKDQTTIKIKEAVSGKELAATDKLQDSVSYVVEFNVVLTEEFAKNYKLSEDPAKYTFNIKTEVKNASVSVETKDGVTLGKKWDDKAITIDDIAKDITSFKVEASETGNAVKKVLTTDIKDANVTLTWKDGNGVEIDAPSDAGQYILEIDYKDDNHNVTPAKLRVVIDPVDIIVVPELAEADQKVTDGDKVDDILKKVTYKVYEVVDGKKSETPMSVDEYFWGEYEDADGDTEQHYQPRAIVQVGTKNGNDIVWESLSDNNRISSDETKQYRVVFAGDLVVYDEYGDYWVTNTTDQVQKNYRADNTDTVKDANSIALTVAATTEVKIDVSDILKDQKGDSYENAISSIYNGEGIYKTKADYKKAKLVDQEGKAVTSDKEKDFTYQWQVITKYDADEEEVTDFSDRNWHNVENLSAPCDAGNYRLKITYAPADDTNAYRVKEEAYVYYTVLPQDAIIEVTGAPAVYADGVTTIGTYLAQVKSDNNIGIKVYTYDKEAKTVGSEIALTVEEQADIRNNLTVMVRAKEGEKSEQFVECGEWVEDSDYPDGGYRIYPDKFEAEREYVLCASDWSWFNNSDNYNLGHDLDSHGKIQSDKMLWSNADKGAKIDVKASEGVEVYITIDTTQIKNQIQEYNGKAFDLSEIKSLVRIINRKTGEDLTETLKDKITYQFENTDDNIKVYDRYDDSNAYKVADKEIVKDGDVIHGGTYKLVAKLEATEVYAAATNRAVDITITPKELVVTPKVKDEVKAGLSTGYIAETSTGSDKYTDNIIADIPNVPDGYIGDDADGVLCYDLYIYNDKVGSSVTQDYVLKSGKTYYATYGYVGLKQTDKTEQGYYDASMPITYFDRDYSVRSERVAFTPVRAEASVDGVTVEAIDNITGSAKDGYVHTITAKAAIPYDKGTRTVDDKAVVKGNEFTIRIEAPKEFDSTEAVDAVFVKAVKAAGGYTTAADGNTKTIEITFNAEAKDVKTFDIVWKPGYKETFTVDFTNVKLEADFTQAVAPKSLAFNAVNKNMAVGGTQQLDVKMTKKQMSDVILLRYASSDDSVLQVSDSGYVTALKTGTATISVFPCYKDKEGEIVPITGAKAATVKMKVAEVAKPKIKKVSVHGTMADLLYAEPANGYRREIYVLEGKNVKEAAFEAVIDTVKNGDYSSFAYVVLDADEDFDDKSVTTGVYGLEPNTDYTVYVRNVSGLRTLEDGTTVAVSATGAVKSFKTTTQENAGLFAYFDLDNTKVYCADTEDRCVAQGHNKYSHQDDKYTINLSDKKAKLSVDAGYYQNLSYSDAGDYIWRALPLSKEDQQKYLNPKLEYYVLDYYEDGIAYDGFTDALKAGRVSQSKLATVDKKGNVTVKGAGRVYVHAVDRATGKFSAVSLDIVAEPNSVKGKNAKLTVGQEIWLSSLLTYKEGKNAIVGYQDTSRVDLVIDQKSNEYFKIEKLDNCVDGDKYTTDYRITPIKAGGKLVLNVTDKTVAQNGGAPAKVTITSKDIAAVQGLKVANVTDTDFGIFFTDKVDSGVDGYKIEVKDERGNILKSEIKYNVSRYYRSNEAVREVNGKKYTAKQWFEMAAGDGTCYYDVKANKYTYYYKITDPSINLLSKYTVSVTAVEGTDNGYAESKAVSKSVKTTNIPASKTNLMPNQLRGVNIFINTMSDGGYDYPLDDKNTLVSGNKYTLTYPEYAFANVRKTDTLTWKSTNTKVATVKANSGSFSATLKAVKPGKTTIEVTSKITRKVIARYEVYVVASGDAGQYFGDNEPYNNSEFAQLFSLDAAINDGSVIEVKADAQKRVKVDAMTRQWFVFTAPAFGTYDFSEFDALCKADKTEYDYDTIDKSSVGLNKGDVVYLSCDNYSAEDDTFTVTVTSGVIYQEVKVGENAVIGRQYYIFAAPTANYYTLKWLDQSGAEVGNDVVTDTYVRGFFAPDEAVKLVISMPNTEEAPKAGEPKTIQFEKTDEWNTYKFVAEEDGLYIFNDPEIAKEVADKGAEVKMQVLASLANLQVSDDEIVNAGAANVGPVTLRKGDVRYIAVKAVSLVTEEGKEKPFECKLSITKATAVEVGKDTQVTVKKSDTTTYEYASIIIPESGDYMITVSTSADKHNISGVKVNGNRLFGTDAKIRAREMTDLKKNQIVQIAFESIASDEVTYTIKVEKLIDDKVKVGDTDVAVASTVIKKVELPVTETGLYTITIKGSEGTETALIGAKTRYIEAGTNEEISFIHPKTETVKVTVKKETINPLKSEDVTLSKDGETKYFKFTADKEGVYTISIPTVAGVTTVKADTLKDIVNSTASWSDVTDQYMAAGKTIYVKMTSAKGLTADATVKVTVSGGVADVATLDKDITVEKNSTKVVSFVAPKKARYEVTTGGMTVTKGNGLDNTDWYIGYANSVVLEAGQKIYFKAVNTDAENSKSFKISEVTTKKADGTDSVSLKNGEGAWFEITAGTGAYYEIKATAELADATPSATMDYIFAGDLTNGGSYLNTGFQYIAPNTKAYVYVVASNVPTDKTATVKVEAKAVGGDELTKADGYELTAYNYYTFSTKVTEDGYYRISADNSFNLNSAYAGNKYLTPKSDTVKLTKGDQLIVRVRAYNTAKYKFQLDKLKVLTSEAQDIAVKKGETGYAVVVAKDAGSYFYTWANGDDIYSNTVEISEIGDWAVVSRYNDGEADATYKVSVKPVTYEPIELGKTITVTQADFKKGAHFYSVDVEAGKAYIVKATNANKYAWSKVTDFEDDSTRIEFVIGDINDKLYIDLWPNTDDKDATLTVTEAKAIELADGQYTIDTSKVESGEPVYLAYTVPEDGEYIESLTVDKDETGTLDDSPEISVVKKVGGAATTAKYYKDNKVLYKVSYTGTNLTKNLTFKVTKRPTQAITTVNEDVTVSVPANEIIRLKYAAAVGEEPTMAISEAVAGVALVDTISETGTHPKTYTWTLKNTNAEAKDVKVKITVPKVDVTLTLGDNDVTFDTSKDPKETSKVVAFTAEKAGEYKITGLDETILLAKGQKYVTTVESDADVNEGKKIVVTVTLVQEASELTLGKQLRGTGVETLYVFTATTGGEYAIKYSNGNSRSLGKLAADQSYMFSTTYETSTLLSVERTDNK